MTVPAPGPKMAVALGLGYIAPDLLGRGRVAGLGRLRREPEPELLALVAEGAAQGVGPCHPIVAAPVGVDHVLGRGAGQGRIEARSSDSGLGSALNSARIERPLRPTAGPCRSKILLQALRSSVSSAGVSSGSLAGSVSSSPPSGQK